MRQVESANMSRTFEVVFVVLVGSVVVCSSTQVNQCTGGDIENLQDLITIENCDKPPCQLKRNTQLAVRFQFLAEDNYESLTQRVTANVAGLDIPFIGVDGTNPCDKIFEEDETKKSNCKFVKGKTYVFKDDFNILPVYPKVKTVVRWAFTDTHTEKNIICFEVPVSIIS